MSRNDVPDRIRNNDPIGRSHRWLRVEGNKKELKPTHFVQAR